MKNILITGHNGFIGNNFLNKIKKKNNIYVLKEKNTSDKLKEIKLNRSFSNIKTFHSTFKKIDYIFLIGSNTSLDFAEHNPKKSYQINVMPILRLLNFIKLNNLNPKIIYLSTTSIYKSSKKIINTKSKIHLGSRYDLNKFIVEKKLLSFSKDYKLDVCILQLSNVYGPTHTTFKKDRGTINKIIRNAKKSKEIKIFGSGNYLRDYIFIDDVINALLKCMTNKKIFKKRKFILCSGESFLIKDTFKLIQKFLEKKYKIKIKLVKYPLKKKFYKLNTRSFKSNSKIFTELTGWKAKYSLKQGLHKMV